MDAALRELLPLHHKTTRTLPVLVVMRGAARDNAMSVESASKSRSSSHVEAWNEWIM